MDERGPQHMDEWGEPVNEWEEQWNEWNMDEWGSL